MTGFAPATSDGVARFLDALHQRTLDGQKARLARRILETGLVTGEEARAAATVIMQLREMKRK